MKIQTARQLLAATAAIIALAGCAPISISELRQETPTRKAKLEAEYTEMGGCVLETLQAGERSEWSAMAGNLSYESVTRKSLGKMTITGFTTHTMKVPIIDIVFSREGEKSTLVETRQGGIGEIRRGGRIVEEQAWPVIERCARGQQ